MKVTQHCKPDEDPVIFPRFRRDRSNRSVQYLVESIGWCFQLLLAPSIPLQALKELLLKTTAFSTVHLAIVAVGL